MELIISAGADHDLQFRFAIFQISHSLVHPRAIPYVERAVHHARKTHDNMRTNMRVNVRRTELPRRVQVPRYCIVAYDDLTESEDKEDISGGIQLQYILMLPIPLYTSPYLVELRWYCSDVLTLVFLSAF